MDQEPIVNTQQGRVRGKICKDFYGGEYLSFSGIPYAEAPIGELRFKAPKPPRPWLDILDATKEGKEPLSRHVFSNNIVGAENCLFLNVYTPEIQLNTLKPVMVWIYGGAFVMGSGNSELYGPDFLMHEDVVVVTFNYRLGILGFLSLQDTSLDVPGNAGLKDQIMALRWVQKNILQFGGDPNNVTLFGESVGGVSIHYMILSPMGKGLFHRAIMQSGCALGSRGQGQYSTPLIVNALKLNISDDKGILNILQAMSDQEILVLQETIPDTYHPDVPRPFGVVRENYLTTDAFMLQDPVDVIQSGKYNDVPVMIGYNSMEGYLAKIMYGKTQVDGDFQREILFTLKVPKDSSLSKMIAQKIKNFYYGNQEPSSHNSNSFYLLQSDNLYVRPIHCTIKHHLATSSEPIYLYRMSLESKLNLFKQHFGIQEKGASHGDDLGYLFKNAKTPKINPQSIEANGIKMITKFWTSFAKFGNPNPISKDPLINVDWKPVEKNAMHFGNIDENFTVGINPEQDRMEFWDSIESMCFNNRYC